MKERMEEVKDRSTDIQQEKESREEAERHRRVHAHRGGRQRNTSSVVVSYKRCHPERDSENPGERQKKAFEEAGADHFISLILYLLLPRMDTDLEHVMQNQCVCYPSAN